MTSTMTRALISKNHLSPRRFTRLFASLAILCLAVSAFGQAQDETTVAKFRGASRSMLNGRTYLVVSVEGPGGQIARVAIPNKGGNRVQYDPDNHLSDAVQDLKSGDLVEISVEMPHLGRPAMLRSIKPYELKPGEDQPNGYVFAGTDEKQSGSSTQTIVELTKLGQKFKVSVARTKSAAGDYESDPKIVSDLAQFKEGDSVFAEISGGTLVTIEPYTEPQLGKLIKIDETEVDGHKVKTAHIDQDGKTIDAMVPGKMNGRTWSADTMVLRELSRLKPGEQVQFRAKDDSGKSWIRSIEPAPKNAAEIPAQPATKTKKKAK